MIPSASAEKRRNAELLAREQSDGAEVLTALPRVVQLEVTNRCSLPCRSCGHRVWDRRANRPGDTPPAALLEIAPLLEAAEEVLLGGYGDPTHGPLLLPIVRAVKGFGCRCVLTTGGAALTEALIADLAEAGLDRVILSMDGARDETLRALRGLPLQAYLAWMEAMAGARARHGGFRPELQLNFVAQRDNVLELPDLVDLAAARGALGVHAFHIKVYDPALADQSLFRHPGVARRAFGEARRRAVRRGLFLRLPPLPGDEDPGCRQPFETLFVLHDGEVRACCASAFKNGRYGLPAGRLGEGDVRALWNSEGPRAFRRASRGGGGGAFPEPCRACPFRVASPEAHLRPLA
ncbi:radical SAM protein [Myxococcota bacterium]|nr:radical SAM protein [Myxococcota bacterium]